MNTTNLLKSEALYQRACEVMPGGVSSPVRAYKSVGGHPPFIASGEGCYVTDVDGKRYLDFVNSWGPLVLGHAHPEVVAAIQHAATLGTSFGAPCIAETELAEKVVALSPVADSVRFVSSGTEATMSAMRLARAVTQRDGFVKFDGCYHGHADGFLVKAGSGLATFGESSSSGVPQGYSELTGVLALDDESLLDQWFEKNAQQTAAVIIEGIPANCGLLPQRQQWLDHLAALCREHGSLLIVDEVITGFRLEPGGFCAAANIDADLVTYGKVIGGGLPVGAYGGRREFMDQVSPQGPVYQAGTLSGNPLCMAAGLATLNVLEQQSGWKKLEQLGAHWQQLLEPILEAEREAGHPISFTRCASIFWLCFGATEQPRSYAAIPEGGDQRYARFFNALLEQGIMIAPSAYEVGFISLAMTTQDLEFAAQGFKQALQLSR